MKKISYLTLIILSVLAFNSCEEQNPTPVTDINLVSFGNTPTVIVEQGSSTEVEVHVYTSQVSGSDRTFNVEVDEDATTTNAANYSVPATVTVPANSNSGSLTVDIIDNELGVDAESLVFQISNSEGIIVGNAANLTIQKFCPFNIDNFVGTYTYTSEIFGDSWPVEVEKVDDHTLVVKDMVEDGKDLHIVFDEASLTASVAKQEVWTHADYGVASFEGAGDFSPCTYKIELDLELTVSAGSFGTGREVLEKN
ncbi:MAG: hypothetical protein ACOC2F_01805 [Bacteroidota bacterium]